MSFSRPTPNMTSAVNVLSYQSDRSVRSVECIEDLHFDPPPWSHVVTVLDRPVSDGLQLLFRATGPGNLFRRITFSAPMCLSDFLRHLHERLQSHIELVDVRRAQVDQVVRPRYENWIRSPNPSSMGFPSRSSIRWRITLSGSFTTEYKVEAAHRVIDSGRIIAEVARELGINEALVGRWVADRRHRLALAGVHPCRAVLAKAKWGKSVRGAWSRGLLLMAPHRDEELLNRSRATTRGSLTVGRRR